MTPMRFTKDAPAWERLRLAVEGFPLAARPTLLRMLMDTVRYAQQVYDLYHTPEGPPAAVVEFRPGARARRRPAIEISPPAGPSERRKIRKRKGASVVRAERPMRRES